ncbi:MAG TPA: CHRD domain-containing protein [Solirubrobacteraceae bacterium]|nr:CHRD domain-containing protein [Solirubrobacteraceae bacterium]
MAVLASAAAVLTIAGGAGAAAAPTTLTASLSGEAEPEGGQGSGTARLTLDPATGRVCFNIRLRGVGTTAAGHIHRGAEGVAGPVVIALYGEPTRRPRGCVQDQPAAAIRQILRRPGRFYVNVHTAAHPDGAARGQLER